jgi:hypothetical protein
MGISFWYAAWVNRKYPADRNLFSEGFIGLDNGASVDAELLALSGLRRPYSGKLGVVQEGALADLLLVDGDPINGLPDFSSNRWMEMPSTVRSPRKTISINCCSVLKTSFSAMGSLPLLMSAIYAAISL